MAAPPASVLAPKQGRSVRTLEKIVAAARSLLDEASFADLSVAQIMARAGMSVGTFYRRFPHKEALLPYLYEHYDRELERDTAAALAPEHWEGLDLTARVRRLVSLCVDSYRAHRGLWRAILIHASSDPTIVRESHRQRRVDMVQRFVARILERRSEISHPDPGRAVEFCLTLLFATCKDQILLAERSHGTTRMPDDRLKEELSRTVLAYLRTTDSEAE